MLSFFLARIGQNQQRQKRCARGKLMGVEKEKKLKSYKMIVWQRYGQNSARN